MNTNISFITDAGVIITLNIKRYEYSRENKEIVFYTNNPFDF